MDTGLRKLLQNVFNLSDKEFHMHLTKDDISNWDSLKHMDLVTTLEKEYRVNLEMLEIVRMRSVADIIKTLRSKGVHLEE